MMTSQANPTAPAIIELLAVSVSRGRKRLREQANQAIRSLGEPLAPYLRQFANRDGTPQPHRQRLLAAATSTTGRATDPSAPAAMAELLNQALLDDDDEIGRLAAEFVRQNCLVLVPDLLQRATVRSSTPSYRAKLLRAVERIRVLPDVRSRCVLSGLEIDRCAAVREIAQRLRWLRPIARSMA